MNSKLITYRIILTLALILIGKYIDASPQLPDYLIYRGDTISVYNLILEKYFEKTNQNNQESLFGLQFREGATLNCWRGYQAIYKIENDSLFLNNIIYCGERYNNKPIDIFESDRRIRELFKDNVINNRVFIDWFSGNIIVPSGDLLRWDGIFYRTFVKEIVLSIKRGIVKDETQVDNYIDLPDRINRRYNDTISNFIFDKIKNLDWKTLDECDCALTYIITIDKNGRVSEVQMADYLTKQVIREGWERNEYLFCINSIRRSIKSLRFDLIKKGGVKVPEKIYIEIWYEETTGQLENWTK